MQRHESPTDCAASASRWGPTSLTDNRDHRGLWRGGQCTTEEIAQGEEQGPCIRGIPSGSALVAASGARIPNEGEADFLFRIREGQPFSWQFQVTEAENILASISAIVDIGPRIGIEPSMANL